MAILVTGASGFLGSALLPRLVEKGEIVYALSRHPPALMKNLVPIEGDILKPNLGLPTFTTKFESVYHLAAVHRLGEDVDGNIWDTNVTGTKNVLKFCADNGINDLKFCSTVYTAGRNRYEQSKGLCELMLNECDLPKVTIFKPSIIMGTEEHPYPGHFSQFVALVIKIHKHAEIIRRKLEGALRLPILEPVFRIRGNPNGKLNLIPVDQVAWAMANINEAGIFWLTHPAPPTISTLGDWVSEFIMVRLKFEQEFQPMPLEAIFEKRASAFTPYLQGDDFPSNLQLTPPVTKQFIHDTIKRVLRA